MPHQCVRCGEIYEKASEEILKGCSKCSGKFFFFIRSDSLNKIEKVTEKLTKKDKTKLEKDMRELIGGKIKGEPIILDIASINISEPGKFELDLVKLFKGEPIIYKLEEGKYFVDVASTFASFKKKKK